MASRVVMDVVERYLTKGAGKVVRDTRQIADAKGAAAAKSSGLLGVLGRYPAVLGAIGIGAFTALLGKATAAWGVQEKAVALVESQLRATGNVIGLSGSQIQAYASELQHLTGVGDELILQQAAVLLRFKSISKDAFPGAMKAALNLSTVLGQDLNSIVLQLGKALDDPIRGLTALQRSGTIFSEKQKKVITALVETGQKAEAQRLILAELESQYGGAAEAARQTLPGALRALGSEFGDIMEEIGALLSASGLPGFIEHMISATRWVKEFLGALRSQREQLAEGERLMKAYGAGAIPSAKKSARCACRRARSAYQPERFRSLWHRRRAQIRGSDHRRGSKPGRLRRRTKASQKRRAPG